MRKALVVSILCSAVLAACSSTPSDQNAASVTDHSSGNGANIARVDASTPNGRGLPPELTDPRNILSKRDVLFDFDSFVIREEFKPLVQAHAQFLASHPDIKMLIQGNTDDRGSREYNLALGQKRAEAVKKALILLGAKEGQIESVSLGKEKPRCSEASEECYAQNRHAEMLYSGEF